MSLEIRKATESDSDLLLALLEEARKFKLSLGDEAWGDYPFTEEDINLRLKSNSCYLAEMNGVVCGSISLIWSDEHNWGERGSDEKAGYIHGLLVGDSHRGYGLGKQMIEWAIAEVKAQGRSLIRLDCSATNRGLCNYYEHLNFRAIDRNHTTVFYERSA